MLSFWLSIRSCYFWTHVQKPKRNEKHFKNIWKMGGGWIGFHFAGFALNDSDFPQNWEWYHNKFWVSGEFVSNTWRPTSAVLTRRRQKAPCNKKFTLKHLNLLQANGTDGQKDLRTNSDIKILLSIDPSSFPPGYRGPKQDEIWHSGYYPAAWTNRDYKMLYLNMGHNDIDYENKTN